MKGSFLSVPSAGSRRGRNVKIKKKFLKKGMLSVQRLPLINLVSSVTGSLRGSHVPQIILVQTR